MDTPAKLQAKRVKEFLSDKVTYARSVTPNNEGEKRPDEKTH